MSKLTPQTLSLKKTIESTFDCAKGWLLSKYPSSVDPKRNFEIDVRYPGEFIPSSICEIFSSPKLNKIDFTKKPIYISLKRGGNEISLKKNIFINNHNIEQISYILAIHSHSGVNYRMIETPDGTIKSQ